MLYHVIYSIWFYPQFHVTAVGLGAYYVWIPESTCILITWQRGILKEFVLLSNIGVLMLTALSWLSSLV